MLRFVITKKYIYLYVYLAARFLEPVQAAVGEIFGESCVRLSLFRQLKHSFISTVPVR
jgi:hypothetical protein